MAKEVEEVTIPVGYEYIFVGEINPGDYIKLVGKILRIEEAGEGIFTDELSGEEYISECVYLFVPSVVEGEVVIHCLPLDQEVQRLVYHTFSIN